MWYNACKGFTENGLLLSQAEEKSPIYRDLRVNRNTPEAYEKGVWILMINSDFYAEYLVPRKPSAVDMLKKGLIGVAAAALAAGFFLVFFMMFPLNLTGVVLIFYLAYLLITNIDVEYEYIVSNGEMDVDKVMGRRKRKRLVTAPISEFTAFGKLSEAPEEPDDCTTVLADDGYSENRYFADFVHKSVGNVRIIFSPSEKILDGMELFLPRQLKAEFKKNRNKIG